MKYYIIAGEASGDLHAANLMKQLKQLDPGAHFRCWGGEKMDEAGGEIVKHYKEMAFMGFWEVAKNIGTVLRSISFCKKDMISYNPDIVILIDFPGFNLKMARFAKDSGLKVIYYISPQVWAWNASRVDTIKKYVDKMIVILPFEEEFYDSKGVKVFYVGHPLLDVLNGIDKRSENIESDNEFITRNGLSSLPVIAILPGSRKQEISLILPTMLKMRDSFKEYQFVIAGAPSIDKQFYQKLILKHSSGAPSSPVEYVFDQTYDLLKVSKAAIVASGTATLETALFEVPQVVCYRGSWFSFMIGKRLVKVPFISLVNLIMEKQTVVELIQSDFNEDHLVAELEHVLNDQERRDAMFNDYYELKKKLGGPGASQRAAKMVFEHIN